jgi:hypothetical protein
MALEVWTSPAFHEEVRTWVADRLAEHGMALTSDGQQPHARVWSSTIRFGTTQGRVWFKVNGRGTRHEPALVRLLGQRLPDLVPEVLALDVESGWSLSRNGGPMLREVLDAEHSWAAWEGIAARYAEAQLELASARDAVLATGVAEVSPATVPDQARVLVERLSGRPAGEGGLTRDETRRLQGMLPRLGEWCVELRGSGIPDSVQHDDLHSGNVCWTGSVADARIIDWGDASWGFPLATLLTTMNAAAFHAGLYVEGRPVDAAPVLRLRDAYLEPFTRYSDRPDLIRLVDLARRAGCVSKALSYEAALLDAPVEVGAALDFPSRAWLLSLLED